MKALEESSVSIKVVNEAAFRVVLAIMQQPLVRVRHVAEGELWSWQDLEEELRHLILQSVNGSVHRATDELDRHGSHGRCAKHIRRYGRFPI